MLHVFLANVGNGPPRPVHLSPRDLAGFEDFWGQLQPSNRDYLRETIALLDALKGPGAGEALLRVIADGYAGGTVPRDGRPLLPPADIEKLTTNVSRSEATAVGLSPVALPQMATFLADIDELYVAVCGAQDRATLESRARGVLAVADVANRIVTPIFSGGRSQAAPEGGLRIGHEAQETGALLERSLDTSTLGPLVRAALFDDTATKTEENIARSAAIAHADLERRGAQRTGALLFTTSPWHMGRVARLLVQALPSFPARLRIVGVVAPSEDLATLRLRPAMFEALWSVVRRSPRPVHQPTVTPAADTAVPMASLSVSA